MSWKNKERNDPGYEDFRRHVLCRDKCCQMPDCGSKYKLQVHHIRRYSDAPTLRTDPYNGIALCRKCHYSIRNKEQFFIGLFLEIAAYNEDNQR